MTDTPQTHDEFYSLIHDYLLGTNQQQLAGHLDTLWQELMNLRSNVSEEPKLIEAEATTDDEPYTEPYTTSFDDGVGGWGYKKVA